MAFRFHLTEATSVAADMCSATDQVDLFGPEFEDAEPALVIVDHGNLEAFVLTGTNDEIISFAQRLLAAVSPSTPGPTTVTGCVECHGTGYLLDQTYGEADIPDGWTPVQRCDTCQTFDSDDDAAAKAATDHGGVAAAFFYGHSRDGLGGDFAIETTPISEPHMTTVDELKGQLPMNTAHVTIVVDIHAADEIGLQQEHARLIDYVNDAFYVSSDQGRIMTEAESEITPTE